MAKKMFIVIGIILMGFIAKDAFLYQIPRSSYADIIQLNWSIDVSKNYDEIYSIDSGASFHGDGERYHIFQYKNSSDLLSSLNLMSGKNTDMESNVMEILNSLQIPAEYIPDFQRDYQYNATTATDSSRIFFIFVPDTKKLYIIEHIL